MPKLKTASTEPKTAGPIAGSGTSRQQLYSYVQRFERLQEEKEALASRPAGGDGRSQGYPALTPPRYAR
jgi:hypothetical protein